MILVTLGTNDKSFKRLLEAIHHAMQEHLIEDEVIVQAGYTKYQDDHMEIHDYFDHEEFETYLEKADLIITHGGVGTIMTALQKGKKVLAAARLAAYQEHVNDHQTQILEAFDEAGYLIYMKDLKDLKPYFERLKNFEPKPYVSNQKQFVSDLKEWIDTH